MTEDSSSEPLVLDTSTASIARVYDFAVGGKDNYEVDRAVARDVGQAAPEAFALAKECRHWLYRVVHFLAGQAGIDQFLDCGSGLPTAENTHQVAQRVNPEAEVVYVDNDPIVGAHGRALLEENERTHFAVADLRDPAAVLEHPLVTKHLDLDRPVALLQCCTLHHLADADQPGEIMAAYRDALAPGSYVALSHFYGPDAGDEYSELARDIEHRFQQGLGTSRFRSYAEITSYLQGLELVEPGWALVRDWWPAGPHLQPPVGMDHLILGAVAGKIN